MEEDETTIESHKKNHESL